MTDTATGKRTAVQEEQMVGRICVCVCVSKMPPVTLTQTQLRLWTRHAEEKRDAGGREAYCEEKGDSPSCSMT